MKTKAYVEVTRDDVLRLDHQPLLHQLAERSERAQWHLKLIGEEQRCIALDGDLKVGVTCTIYALRPTACQLVQVGDDECLRARRHFGLPLLAAEDAARIAELE